MDLQELPHHPVDPGQDLQGDAAGLLQEKAQRAPAPLRLGILQFHQFHALGLQQRLNQLRHPGYGFAFIRHAENLSFKTGA